MFLNENTQHENLIVDSDVRFIINPTTRAITTESPKVRLVQGDHNCERFSFEIPRTVEGHDMSLCDKVEVHYINVSTSQSQTSADVYVAKDLQVQTQAGKSVVLFSWLVSKNATKYAGSLHFVVRFVCLDGEEIAYSWSTSPYKGISIMDGINNSEAVVEQYADVLEEWENALFNASDTGYKAIEEARAAAIAEIDEKRERLLDEIEIAADIVQDIGDSETAVMSQKAVAKNFETVAGFALLKPKEADKYIAEKDREIVIAETTVPGYYYYEIECAEGDLFLINSVIGGTISSILFVDANGQFVARSAMGVNYYGIITIPYGVSKIYINDKSGNAQYKLLRDQGLMKEMENIKIGIGMLSPTICDVYARVYRGYLEFAPSTAATYYIYSSSCNEGDVFTIDSVVGGAIKPYILIDADGNVVQTGNAGENFKGILTIPSGVSAIYINDKSGAPQFKGVQAIGNEQFAEDNEGRNAFGGFNATMRAKQIAEMEYTPVADMEKQVNGYANYRHTEIVKAGTPLKGVLYSSSQHAGGQIGTDVSLYTFLSAARNPNSKVYTYKGIDYNGFLWYGSVCTGLVCHALGIPEKLPTTYFMKDLYKGFREVDAYNVRIGDVMAKAGHVRLVTMVEKDAYGRITSVEITESTHSFARTVVKPWKTYIDEINNGGYHIVRYDKLKDVEYTPDGCVILDGETTTPPTFPDILSDYGDKCVIHEGDDIAFTVMDSTGYNSIEIYKDGELVDTRDTATDFTLERVSPGKYEVKLVGSVKTSSCYFIAIDCLASYEENNVTFESTYGVLQSVTSHKTQEINSNGIYSGQTAAFGAMVLDNPAGSGTVDVSYVFEHAGGQNITTGDYLCLHFKCEYGRVEFKLPLE